MTFGEKLTQLECQCLTLSHCIENGVVFVNDEYDWDKCLAIFPKGVDDDNA